MTPKPFAAPAWLALALVGLLATFGVSCDEKKSSDAPASKPGKTDKGEGDDKAEEGEEGNDPTTSKTGTDTDTETTTEPDPNFDLCSTGLEKTTKLAGFEAYVEQLCGDKKIVTLRKADSIFNGTTAKIFEDNVEKGDLETSLTLSTSALYDAKPEDYWALVKLQFSKPDKFKVTYEEDPDADMQNVVPSATQSTYRYTNNSDEGGAVDYDAKTVFIELKGGQAWVAATSHVKKYETMKALKGLIIINKTKEGKTEVFTISDQTYDHASGQSDQLYSRAKTSLANEQKRAFTNAKTADQAPDILEAD